MFKVWPYNDRRWVVLEGAFAVFFLALLIYSILDWRGLLPGTPSWRPLALVYLSSALLLQSLARLASRRSKMLFVTILAVSFLFLWFSATAR